VPTLNRRGCWTMQEPIWPLCLTRLENDLPIQQFNTWIRPLQAIEKEAGLTLLAPNRYVRDTVERDYLGHIAGLANNFRHRDIAISIDIGSDHPPRGPDKTTATPHPVPFKGRLNAAFTFVSHVAGKSNQLARAAAQQVGENPGRAYNPLFIYGGVGLGKTHLMQAAGNAVVERAADARVVYVHSERFVADMVKALQHNEINNFKRYYRSLDVLLIDDIQFFAGKSHSQEEFFHTFNTLLDGQRQVIITSDRFPREISGVQERLISRFGSGLTVPIDPPELETRVAILIKKALAREVTLPEDVAFFIAEQIRSNVRELEGALHRLVASANFTGRTIDVDLARDALRDLLDAHQRQINIQNIQKTVADYFKMRVSDLHSRKRSRQIARPRQMAMALAKELTPMSLPEIGDAFGGRDHTTVLHAQRKIKALLQTDPKIKEDYHALLRLLLG